MGRRNATSGGVGRACRAAGWKGPTSRVSPASAQGRRERCAKLESMCTEKMSQRGSARLEVAISQNRGTPFIPQIELESP